MRAISLLILVVAGWPVPSPARPFQNSDYHLFESEQAAARRAIPHDWHFERRWPVQDHGFTGITLIFRGPRMIYDPPLAETLPILPSLKRGGGEEVTLTLWPADYEPHRASVLSRIRELGMDADQPDPIAGSARVKITASANFNAETTPGSWPTWRQDLIKAMRLKPIPPSARQLRRAQEQKKALADGLHLDTPARAIEWAETEMRKADFSPSAKPYVRQHRDGFIVFWPNAGGFDAILIVSKATNRFFAFGGALKKP